MDFTNEQAGIERRRKIAEMLMQQGAEPLQTDQVAGGYVVPVSPLRAVAKIAQQMAGAYIGKKSDESAANLKKQQAAALSGIDFSAADAPARLAAAGLDDAGVKLALAAAEQKIKNANADPYFSAIDTGSGLFKMNARTGEVTPMMSGDQRLTKASSDAALQALLQNAKSGQQNVKATDAQGREFISKPSEINPGAFPNLLTNLIQTESSGNPNAVSNKGAQGLTQIMPETAQNPGFGVKPMQDNSPKEQIRFGAEYLTALLDHYDGDVNKALAAYNAGPGNIDQNGITNQGYVDKVIKGPSLSEKAAVEVQKAGSEAQTKAGIENQQAIEKTRQKEIESADKMGQALSGMMRYLYPNGEPVRDAQGRLATPETPMLLGNGPMDRLAMLGHEQGIHNDKASNVIALRRYANDLVLGMTNGSLGTGFSNADRDFMQSRVGIIDKAQDPKDIYNAVADMEDRVRRIQEQSVNKPGLNLENKGGTQSIDDLVNQYLR